MPTPDKPPPPVTPQEKSFEQWMSCMTIENYRSARMGIEWNNIESENNTECENCHENGAEGFIATRNESKMFNVIKTNRYYALQYFTYDATKVPVVVVANEVAMTGVANAQDPHREHPMFDPGEGLAASRTFAALTQQRFEAGPCQ
jgi:hypothetical protein